MAFLFRALTPPLALLGLLLLVLMPDTSHGLSRTSGDGGGAPEPDSSSGSDGDGRYRPQVQPVYSLVSGVPYVPPGTSYDYPGLRTQQQRRYYVPQVHCHISGYTAQFQPHPGAGQDFTSPYPYTRTVYYVPQIYCHSDDYTIQSYPPSNAPYWAPIY